MKVLGKGNELVWDAQNDRALAQFRDGACDCDNATAERLKKLGYAVETPPHSGGEEGNEPPRKGRPGKSGAV